MQKLSRKALNPIVSSLKPSATLAINELSNQLIGEGRKIFKWGLGQSPFPVPDSVVDELRKHAHEKDYLPVKGLLPLRSAVSSYYNTRFNLEFDAGNILIGPGSKELIYQLQAALNSELILPVPSWVSYSPQANLLKRSIVPVTAFRSDRFLVMAGELENTLKKRNSRNPILLLNYPNNPTGTTYSESELIDIARVCREYGVLVLSDEIYAELNHKGDHVSIARYYPEGTVVSSGLSKWCGAGGWRLGTFAFPEQLSWLSNAIATIASETFTSVSAPIQWAAIKAFEMSEEIQDYIIKSRELLTILGKYIADQMQTMDLDLPTPEGGFYILVDFRKHRDWLRNKGVSSDEDLAKALLNDTGIATLPGSAFGLQGSDLILRMSYVDFDGTGALKNNNHDPADFAPGITESLDVLKDWLGKT